jgi:hypothetical protein
MNYKEVMVMTGAMPYLTMVMKIIVVVATLDALVRID